MRSNFWFSGFLMTSCNAFWRKQILVLETSCITHTQTHTHTHTLKWQTEIERTLSKKLNTLWGWTFYWNVNIWEQNIFSYNFIFSCCLKWIYLRLICTKIKKWWRCLSIRQPLSKMWKHQNRFQNKNAASWKKRVGIFCVRPQLK